MILTRATMFTGPSFPSASEFASCWKEAVNERATSSLPMKADFSPYSSEGGTVAGIRGTDFVVLGSDMRMSARGSVILSRNTSKLNQLSEKIVLASGGCRADVTQLVKMLTIRMKVYNFNFREDMDIGPAAEMLGRTLYYKRFFPYYAANIIGGIDTEGKGQLYSYDPVGTTENVPYSASGDGTSYIDPFLDAQIGGKTQPPGFLPPLTKERAVDIMRDAFRATTERETGTGDGIHIIVLQHGKSPEDIVIRLRKD